MCSILQNDISWDSHIAIELTFQGIRGKEDTFMELIRITIMYVGLVFIPFGIVYLLYKMYKLNAMYEHGLFSRSKGLIAFVSVLSIMLIFTSWFLVLRDGKLQDAQDIILMLLPLVMIMHGCYLGIAKNRKQKI